MAVTLRTITNRYLQRYQRQLPNYKLAADQAKQLIADILADSTLDVHAITSRCKSPDSLRLKLRRKGYRNPARQVTDKIGVRVISYYENDVPPIAAALSQQLEINLKKSEDKRQQLDLREFGYLSVHLIARTKGTWARSPRYAALRNIWFEIQVRSILEHAWAEIEHEVVYKSGVKYPDSVRRRFARLAGTLELLEEEFLSLRQQPSDLVNLYLDRFEDGLSEADPLDAARLIALLEAERPDLVGWRRAAADGKAFPVRIEAFCVEALKAVNIKTVKGLRGVLRSRSFKNAVRRYAGFESEAPTHLALSLIAVALRSAVTFKDYFPSMSANPAMVAVFQMARARK